jgi:hypothetical protein
LNVHIIEDKSKRKKIEKQFKPTHNYCPYFLDNYGKQVHCICQDILDAPEGTYCHMLLYYKEPENKDNKGENN